MTEDSVVALHHPGVTADPLTAVLRAGARELLAQAIEAEVAAVLAAHEHLKTEDGRRRLVRHGHGPERAILTGIGPVSVRRPKVRDRGSVGGERIRFTSAILPRFARRTRSLDAVLPTLYLRGVSSGDFQEALEALLGKDASGLSAQVIGRLKAEWEAEHERWRRRDLSARRYVYMWADGIHLQGRLEDEKQCILVLIGATPEGRKELVGFQAGVRESAQSWRELLACLRGRGLTIGPELAIGDGALGFWKALEEIFPDTRRQRCWVHKTANVLNKLPKSRQTAAKAALHDIWMADGRAEAECQRRLKIRPKGGAKDCHLGWWSDLGVRLGVGDAVRGFFGGSGQRSHAELKRSAPAGRPQGGMVYRIGVGLATRALGARCRPGPSDGVPQFSYRHCFCGRGFG